MAPPAPPPNDVAPPMDIPDVDLRPSCPTITGAEDAMCWYLDAGTAVSVAKPGVLRVLSQGDRRLEIFELSPSGREPAIQVFEDVSESEDLALRATTSSTEVAFSAYNARGEKMRVHVVVDATGVIPGKGKPPRTRIDTKKVPTDVHTLGGGARRSLSFGEARARQTSRSSMTSIRSTRWERTGNRCAVRTRVTVVLGPQPVLRSGVFSSSSTRSPSDVNCDSNRIDRLREERGDSAAAGTERRPDELDIRASFATMLLMSDRSAKPRSGRANP